MIKKIKVLFLISLLAGTIIVAKPDGGTSVCTTSITGITFCN